MNKAAMTETEICQNYITSAVEKGGWDRQTQIRSNFLEPSGSMSSTTELRTWHSCLPAGIEL
jgi:type I site-specific restriction endonuclease